MNTEQYVCNYAILRYLPYREREEFVNVGVLVTCPNPCIWHFFAETKMPERIRAFFPNQDVGRYEAAFESFYAEMKRRKGIDYTPHTLQMAFNETVRIRESVFRFGEPRTIMTDNPRELVDKLFARYVEMKTRSRKRRRTHPRERHPAAELGIESASDFHKDTESIFDPWLQK